MRALAAAVEREAAQRVAAVQLDLGVLNQRATSAEAELARVRAEGIRVQQEARVKLLDVDDREEELKGQIARLQGSLAEAMDSMRKQGSEGQQVGALVVVTHHVGFWDEWVIHLTCLQGLQVQNQWAGAEVKCRTGI